MSSLLDPTVLALLSIFGGVVITAEAGLFGAWIQSRREHHRWVRERRYEAYLNFVATADKWAIRMSNGKLDPDDAVFYDDMVRVESAVDLMGTQEARDAMDPIRSKILGWPQVSDAAASGYAMEYWELNRAFVKVARDQVQRNRVR